MTPSTPPDVDEPRSFPNVPWTLIYHNYNTQIAFAIAGWHVRRVSGRSLLSCTNRYFVQRHQLDILLWTTYNAYTHVSMYAIGELVQKLTLSRL